MVNDCRCDFNLLESIDVSKCPDLTLLVCSDNNLQPKLDVSQNKKLSMINCSNNPYLTELIINKNHAIKGIDKDPQTQLVLSD